MPAANSEHLLRAGFELEIIPMAFTTSSPAGMFLVILRSAAPSVPRVLSRYDAGVPVPFLLAQLLNHALHRRRHDAEGFSVPGRWP